MVHPTDSDSGSADLRRTLNQTKQCLELGLLDIVDNT